LIDEIERQPNIRVLYRTEVRALHGDRLLDGITVESAGTASARLEVSGLFSFIGAEPCTAWLRDMVELDGHGFVLTGQDLRPDNRGWQPLPLETSLPGIFCAGDARFGSIKRVATAVGEGAMAVRMVHDRRATPYVAAAAG
jgi:thioredoxin reductase (NADPH)